MIQLMGLMDWIALALLLGLIPATVAASKGHNFILWWIYGALMFAGALPHAVLAPRDVEALDRRKAREGYGRCPACAEMVRKRAQRCRYCQESLVEAD